MKFLLVAATGFEVQPFVEQHPDIDVLITGVGVPNTIFKLQEKLNQAQYDFIIQAGIAGAFNNDLELGKVVNVVSDCFGDLGIFEGGKFKSVFGHGFADGNQYPFHNGTLPGVAVKQITNCKAITVNKVTDDERDIGLLREYYAADIESMEGAGFHFVALQKQVNGVQIRAISNYVGERDKTKWATALAIEKLNNQLSHFIKNINDY